MPQRCTHPAPAATGKTPQRPQHRPLEPQLRAALTTALQAWMRSNERSLDDFADALERADVRVTLPQLRKWTAANAEDLRRSVPAQVVAAWVRVTGDQRPLDLLIENAAPADEPLRDTLRRTVVEFALLVEQLNALLGAFRARQLMRGAA